MWKTCRSRSERFLLLTSLVQGAYQHAGPQGMIARVGFPALALASTASASSLAMSWPISLESQTRRNFALHSGCRARSRGPILHHL